MTFKTSPALMGVAVPVQLNWEGGRFLLGLMQKLCGGVMGLSLVHLMGLMEQLCRRVVGLGFVHLMERLSGRMVRLSPMHLVSLMEKFG